MLTDWRNLRVGDWFRTSSERLNAEGTWVFTTFEITKLAHGYVEFRATHDHTNIHTRTIGWVIDNGHDLF